MPQTQFWKIQLQTYVVVRKLVLGMTGVCAPKVSIVYDLWIQYLWIKVQSALETVYEASSFSLKLLGVLSKPLA